MNYMWSIYFFLAINETVLFSVLFDDIQSGLIKSHGLISDLIPKKSEMFEFWNDFVYMFLQTLTDTLFTIFSLSLGQ